MFNFIPEGNFSSKIFISKKVYNRAMSDTVTFNDVVKNLKDLYKELGEAVKTINSIADNIHDNIEISTACVKERIAVEECYTDNKEILNCSDIVKRFMKCSREFSNCVLTDTK